ncbi:hypothetical protein ABIB40_000223 [Pedobacter sp. UYP30]|uniref:MGH1-like glycoside hydrolase domain-containing protein n=1 Tax=Pedobacter sp. UYP30 TaxID=1756400 RepID=UPI003396239A
MKKVFLVIFIAFLIGRSAFGQSKSGQFLNEREIAKLQYGKDANWYLQNIPFFECSDKTLEEVYYYRWRLLKSHVIDLGAAGHAFTEFLNGMTWDLKPWNTINCATTFHIYEARWLKNPEYVEDYINFMYKEGGNDRHFTEAIANATYANYLVNPDKKFITSQLSDMVRIYNAWNDHYDPAKKLYYVEPISDATEYTISSILANGGKDGFRGGDAFRPSINTYMYANALAIKNVALLNKDSATANLFAAKAKQLKSDFQRDMWNEKLQHFTDRYKVTNEFVKYWDFIPGRELVGYVPWTFNLPDDDKKFSQAWSHVKDSTELNGKYGLRTVEPSFPYYMRQYRYDNGTGLKECQWNGPSWPFQTTQVLMGMANLLHNYHQRILTADDYTLQLKKYAKQHYYKDSLNILEDYNPDKPEPIVYIDERSEHYNHSGFGNLIISGLCGIEPQANNAVKVKPLVGKNINYFCLENVAYHGHVLSVLYDRDGKKYKQGAGLIVFVDGKLVKTLGNDTYLVGEKKIISKIPGKVNLMVNVSGKGFPMAKASFTAKNYLPYMAIDGRNWDFKNVRNSWTNAGSTHALDWLEVDFGKKTEIGQIKILFSEQLKEFKKPKNYLLEYDNGEGWKTLKAVKNSNSNVLTDIISFKRKAINKIRLSVKNSGDRFYTAVSEIRAY